MARKKKARTPANTPDQGELANAVLQSAASAPTGQVEVIHQTPGSSGVRGTVEHNFVPAGQLAGHMANLHAQGVSVAHVVDEGGHLNGGQGVVHVPMVPVGRQGSNQWQLPGQKAVGSRNQARYDKEVAATAKAGGLSMSPGVLHRNGVPLSPRTSTSDRPAFGMATGTDMLSRRDVDSAIRVKKAQKGVDTALSSLPDAAHKFRRRMETVGDPYFGEGSAARRAEEFQGAEDPMAMEGPLRGPEQKVDQLRGEHEELMAKHPEYAKAVNTAALSHFDADEALQVAQQGQRTTRGKTATQRVETEAVPTSASENAGVGTTSVPARFELGSAQAASPSPSAAARAGRAAPEYDVDPSVSSDIHHLHGVAHLASALMEGQRGIGGASHTALVNHMGVSESLRGLVQSIGSLPASESLPHYLARNIGAPSAEKSELSLAQVASEARQMAQNHYNNATNQETYSLSDQFQELKGGRGKTSRGSWVAGSAPEVGHSENHELASQVISGALAARGQLPKNEPYVSQKPNPDAVPLAAIPIRALRGGEDRSHALGGVTPTSPVSRFDPNELPYGTQVNDEGELEVNPESHGPWQEPIIDQINRHVAPVQGNVVSQAHANPLQSMANPYDPKEFDQNAGQGTSHPEEVLARGGVGARGPAGDLARSRMARTAEFGNPNVQGPLRPIRNSPGRAVEVPVASPDPRAASGEAFDAMGDASVELVKGGHSEGKPNAEDVGDHAELHELGARIERHGQAGDAFDTHEDYLAAIRDYAAKSTALIGGTSRELGAGELERSNVQPPSSERWNAPTRPTLTVGSREAGTVRRAPTTDSNPAPATQLGSRGIQAVRNKGERGRGQGAAKYAENLFGDQGSVTGLAPEKPGTLNPADFKPLPYYKPNQED